MVLIASAADTKLGLNHPRGPFEMMGLIGIGSAAQDSGIFCIRPSAKKYRPSPRLRKYVRKGVSDAKRVEACTIARRIDRVRNQLRNTGI